MPRGFKHGHIQIINGRRVASPEYNTWQMMKNRCLNSLSKDYHRYGGRGIKLDPRWLSFEDFFADMGRRPSPIHTLDRIHNNGAYTKANCRWATRKTQVRNRPATNRLTKSMADQIRLAYSTGNYYQYTLAKKFGVSPTLVSAIVRGVIWQ